jgi:hypothetical protein
VDGEFVLVFPLAGQAGNRLGGRAAVATVIAATIRRETEIGAGTGDNHQDRQGGQKNKKYFIAWIHGFSSKGMIWLRRPAFMRGNHLKGYYSQLYNP